MSTLSGSNYVIWIMNEVASELNVIDREEEQPLRSGLILIYIYIARKNYKSTISRSKSIYYNKKIAFISSNPRKLFKIANKILSSR